MQGTKYCFIGFFLSFFFLKKKKNVEDFSDGKMQDVFTFEFFWFEKFLFFSRC